jgi:predicted acyltransferase (DUF342 family)
VSISGEVVASSDARIDMWSRLGSSVQVGKNAYLGEFVAIDGKLTVEGDLDVGKEVKIKSGFETKGWIVVRNPVPVIMFLFLYIREVMRLGKGEEVEKALEDLFEEEEDEEESFQPGEKLMVVPADTKFSPEGIELAGDAVIGNNCLLLGNIKARSVKTGEGLKLMGSIHSEGNITLGDNSIIHGSLVSKGQVHIGRNSRIYGAIKADSTFLHEKARVDGTIRAPSGVSFVRAPTKKVSRRIKENSPNSLVEEAVQALGVVEIESMINKKTNPGATAKNAFVIGKKKGSARARVSRRTNRFTAFRISRRNSGN